MNKILQKAVNNLFRNYAMLTKKTNTSNKEELDITIYIINEANKTINSLFEEIIDNDELIEKIKNKQINFPKELEKIHNDFIEDYNNVIDILYGDNLLDSNQAYQIFIALYKINASLIEPLINKIKLT